MQGGKATGEFPKTPHGEQRAEQRGTSDAMLADTLQNGSAFSQNNGRTAFVRPTPGRPGRYDLVVIDTAGGMHTTMTNLTYRKIEPNLYLRARH